MNDIELGRQVWMDVTMDRFGSTFLETSARKVEEDGEDKSEKYALDSSGDGANVRCLDFDSVKLHFYPPRPSIHTPCSVDAVTFERNGTFLIEFKFRTAKLENITRKIYDSIMLFIEKNGYDFARARDEIVYIVVSTNLERWKSPRRALFKAHSYCRKPWEALRKEYDRWRLQSLEGVVVRKAYAMPPDLFDYYVSRMRWK